MRSRRQAAERAGRARRPARLILALPLLLQACTLLGAPPCASYEGRWLLSSDELACLAAEVCAATTSDLGRSGRRSRAWALDLGDGAWRVHYARRADGLFLPEADGCFEHDRFLEGDGPAFVDDPPASPLGRIWYRRYEAVAPWPGARDRVRVEIRPDGTGAARARIEITAPGRLDRDERLAAIRDVFDAAERCTLGLKLDRAGDRDEALRILAALCRRYGSGRSQTLDLLLARAWALQARLLEQCDRPLDAERALRLARMLAPDSVELSLAQAALQERIARPERAAAARARALASMPPGTLAGRLLARSVGPETSEAAPDLDHCLDEARRALASGDATRARNWADRARDLAPDAPEAMLLLAEALEDQGRIREARDLRVQCLHEGPPVARQVLALSRDELALGHADLALRWLLRYADHLADRPLQQDPVPDILAALGPEGSLRVLRSEGFLRESLPLVRDWLAAEDCERSRMLATVLARQGLEAARRDALRRLAGSPPAEEATGASGIRVEEPTASPGR